jgi:hypothetical protein
MISYQPTLYFKIKVMRSYLLCLLTFFIVDIANAQGPTITYASEAVPGDVLVYPHVKLTGVAMPAAGANMMWDYSGLIDSGSIEIDSFDTAPTIIDAIFPGTNLALQPTGGTSLYFETTTSTWSALGFLLPGVDTGFYLSTLNEFHFPFSYGSTSIDSTKEVAHISGLKDTSEIIVSQQATGYGTLKIPGQTYNNVLLVKKITTTRSSFGQTATSSFIFVSPSAHSFLLQINLDAQNNFNEIKYIFTGTGIPPTSYTFNGNGNWDDAANWSGDAVPPSLVPSGTQVTISPQPGGSCILDVPVTFTQGSTLTVTTGAKFNIMGNLTILDTVIL